MSRVIHISLAHTPTDVRIFEKECKSLAEAGYEVYYLVPKTTNSHKDGVYLRTLSQNDSKSRLRRIIGRSYAAYCAAIKLQGDIYHLHDPELIPVGMMLKLKRKIVIYDAHEDAPIEAISLNKQRRLNGILLSLTWRLYLIMARIAFDGFIAATPTIAQTLPQKKTAIVRNYPRLERFVKTNRTEVPTEKAKTLIYIGTISEIRGIKQMLDALALIPKQLKIKLQIIGEFTSSSLKNSAMAHSAWQMVDYHPHQPWTHVIEKLSKATIGLVLLHPTPEYKVSLPVKLFEYMASGIPVIASDFPLWRTIVDSAQCGLLTDPLNPQQIAETINKLIEKPDLCHKMGRAGQDAVHKRYSWHSEKENLLALYKRLSL
jgi:glycosyltransferase involved in cell wall biosynthesis